ncbi:MAG: hypothetical protein GXP32_01790 [Kiritimatiellaeota bacterium]|nr:hypothetical protein [Kiritimatiellota bacterium]
MKMSIIKNKKVSVGIRIFLIVIAITLILGFTFSQGMFYANKKATVRIANDNCFFTIYALEVFDEPAKAKKYRSLFKNELNASSIKLAEMCLKYPNYISRGNYNLLIHVKKYKKNVDPKVDKAITYMESIHDMKTWGVFNINEFIKNKR